MNIIYYLYYLKLFLWSKAHFIVRLKFPALLKLEDYPDCSLWRDLRIEELTVRPNETLHFSLFDLLKGIIWGCETHFYPWSDKDLTSASEIPTLEMDGQLKLCLQFLNKQKFSLKLVIFRCYNGSLEPSATWDIKENCFSPLRLSSSWTTLGNFIMVTGGSFGSSK